MGHANENADSADLPGAQEPSSPASWYGEGVRPTEPRTPEEELAGFHLPQGFEIRLFAAEPEIAKPMNVGFDRLGRVWVTDSYEYPHPAPPGEAGKDSVRILQDLDQDGKADKSTVFADGLNIPIGILPFGEGCICYSIPNIYYLRDTDGDDVCDTRDIILGPFDTSRDTHGMVNAMRLGSDGWIYANHGFNNQSTVSGTDGHSITMHSGNTFRFRPDGSRVELVTSGQVNPFGRTTDVWGYDYTADCHSKPISQLIHGGFYPSFGRPHDGLGFVPPMMDHLHGSTAISGLAYIPEGVGMEPLVGQMLSGNVMTSRINRNKVLYEGATAKADARPDFLTSDDPWFRPVDVRLGPDGFLYVADFYNKIIGHYEVPLDHPGRDRFRGRIWQIRYTGTQSTSTTDASIDNLQLPVDWNSPNPTRRGLAVQNSVIQGSQKSDQAALALINGGSQTKASSNLMLARISAAAYLAQRNRLESPAIDALLSDPNPIVRTRALRLLAGTHKSLDVSPVQLAEYARAAIKDANPHVRQAAAELAGRIEQIGLLRDLLAQLCLIDQQDPILRQSIRIAVRDILPSNTDFSENVFAVSELPPKEAAELADIMLAINGTTAGTFLLDYLSNVDSVAQANVLISHMIRNLPGDRFSKAIQLVRKMTNGDVERELAMLQLASEAIDEKDVRPSAMMEWATEVAKREFVSARELLASGQALSADWNADLVERWPLQTRGTTDNRQISMSSSIGHGESYTGTYQTSAFILPEKISFWIAGHRGFPDQAEHGKNRVELVEVTTGRVLRTAFPPRNDVAREIVWDCPKECGSLVRLECIDGDNGSAYAWLAVGDFRPPWLDPTETATAVDRFRELVEQYNLLDLRESLVTLVQLSDHEPMRQTELAMTIAELENRQTLVALLRCVKELLPNAPNRESLIQAAVTGSNIDDVEQSALISTSLTAASQQRFADLLSSGTKQLQVLVKVIQRGALSPTVLLDKSVWDKINAVGDDNMVRTVNELRKAAAPLDSDSQQRMEKITKLVAQHRYDAQVAKSLFTKHCAVCHQLKGEGQVIGPQLDGIGARGAARLTEDVLQPDRNVDVAFRTTTFLTASGTVVTGLVRDENDQRILLVGQDGKAVEIAVDEVEQRRSGTNSLMPSNFHEVMAESELVGVIRYLTETAVQK